jgi:hypothetical protein
MIGVMAASFERSAAKGRKAMDWQRNFLLVGAPAAAVAIPVFGQALSPTVGSANEAFATLHSRAQRRASPAIVFQGGLS